MKPGEGAGYLLADIAKGMSREDIRKRYQSGEYGKGDERPRADYVDGWLKQAGR